MISQIKEKIDRYKTEAKKKRPEGDCPYCDADSCLIHLHDSRKRQFLLVYCNYVYKFFATLFRWKCSSCNKTWTYYPDYALPFKRYIIETIETFSREHAENEHLSYRQAAKYEDMPIAYGGEELNDKNNISSTEIKIEDERFFCHTTLWRWVAYLGGLNKEVCFALDLIKQKESTSALHRFVSPVAPSRYRSEARRILVGNCQKCLKISSEFSRLFKDKLFPRFATKASEN